MRTAISILVCLMICSAVLFAAGDQQPLNVKTGLWQVDYTVKYSGLPPDMQAALDRMNSQQKKAMGFDAPKTYKTCVTAKKLDTPWTEGDNNCQWNVLKSTSSDLEVHGTQCEAGKQQGLNTDVDVKIHADNAQHVTATMHGTATGNGMNTTLDGNYTGKWISASCPAE